MSLKEKSIYGFVLLVLVLLVQLFINRKTVNLHQDLIGQKEAYEQLSKSAAKLEVEYVNQKEAGKLALKLFAEHTKALKSKIEVLSSATFLIKEKAREMKSSDLIWDGKSKFVMNEIRFNDGPAVGYVLIFDDGRVVSKMYKHEINVNQAVSKDGESGRYAILSKADYILKSSALSSGKDSWLNKRYPLQITGGTAYVDPTVPDQLSPKFFWWNPKLNANLNVDGSINPGIGISVSGYGKSKNDLDFKFLQLGVDLKDKKPRATLTPILWRPFSNLIQNTYIGAGVSYDLQVGYFLGFQLGF